MVTNTTSQMPTMTGQLGAQAGGGKPKMISPAPGGGKTTKVQGGGVPKNMGAR